MADDTSGELPDEVLIEMVVDRCRTALIALTEELGKPLASIGLMIVGSEGIASTMGTEQAVAMHERLARDWRAEIDGIAAGRPADPTEH